MRQPKTMTKKGNRTATKASGLSSSLCGSPSILHFRVPTSRIPSVPSGIHLQRFLDACFAGLACRHRLNDIWCSSVHFLSSWHPRTTSSQPRDVNKRCQGIHRGRLSNRRVEARARGRVNRCSKCTTRIETNGWTEGRTRWDSWKGITCKQCGICRNFESIQFGGTRHCVTKDLVQRNDTHTTSCFRAETGTITVFSDINCEDATRIHSMDKASQ